MWLSERTAAHTDSEGASGGALVGTVTIGGEKCAVLLNGEYRSLGLAAPQGVSWRPGAGTQVLVVETGDGERFIVGAVTEAGEASPGAAGELRTAGVVRHTGSAYFAGDVYVTGKLYLNGKEVTVKEGD